MPQFSIIVPVYKVEAYLPACVDSILNQSFSDFELILVDDGSPDRCGEICDEYAARDQRVRVIHKENGGVSSARNCGIKIACGNWIWFIDSDDYVEANSLDSMSQLIKEESAALYVFECDGNSEFYAGDFEEFLWKYYFTYVLQNSSCNKLYSAELIRRFSLAFDEQESIGEDLLFNIYYYAVLFNGEADTRVVFTDKHFYHYVKREGSAMNTASKKRLAQQMRLFDKIEFLLEGRVSPEVICYFFLLHFVSGIRQAAAGGMTANEFAAVFPEKQYMTRIKRSSRVLSVFFRNENASLPGRIRVRLLLWLLSIGQKKTAGKLMSLS